MDKETSRTIIAVAAIIAATIILVSFKNGFGSIGSGSAPIPQQAAPNVAPVAPEVKIDVKALPDDDPAMGPANAKVTIVEFSDYQCPFCERFYTNVEKQMITDYVKTGKVRFIYRDFPLGFHPNAQPAAEAAECADEQGKFWQFHDKVFENQASMSDANYQKWAKDLGLDMKKFSDCTSTHKYAAEVKKDAADGQAAGVSGTPTTFINGRKIVGAQPYATVKAAIDAELG